MKRRDYRAEYRRRQEKARERGFQSYSEQRKAARRIRNAKDLASLPADARESRAGALKVLRRARRDHVPIEVAAAELRVPFDTVRWWAPEGLGNKAGGLTLPTQGDRILQLRAIILQGEAEVDLVAIRGSRAVLRVEQAFDVQWRFITGQADPASVEALRGVRAAGRPVEADPERLREIAAAGGVDVPEAYRAVMG